MLLFVNYNFLEELQEMSGTCSSGYLTRLMNTLTGFDGWILRISWEDQLIGNLNARLRTLLKDTPNSDIILEEMVNRDMKDRPHFLAFFRKHISTLRETLYTEFKDSISDIDFDYYFRNAFTHYTNL